MTRALGRRVEHDPRSRQYAARRVTRPRSVLWRHNAPVLDQGDLGSCTGNALAQCLNTTPFAASRPSRRYLDVPIARLLYAKSTVLDEFPGQWPTQDTGSSSLGACKAGVALGYLSAYHHAFGFNEAIAALALSPAIAGFNWYEQMFDVDAEGFIRIGGDMVGGHEVAVLGVNVRGRYVTILNSWGQWGRNGRARIAFDDFARLLDEQGDVTVPIGRT